VINFIQNLFKFAVILILLLIFILRFRTKDPRFIFLEVSADFGFISLILFILNAILLAYLIYKFTKKTENSNKIINAIKKQVQIMVEDAYQKRSSNKYWKIAFNFCYNLCWHMPILIPTIVVYFTKILFIYALLYDVFKLEYFFYSYKAICLYILISILKVLLNISHLHNTYIRAVLKQSIIYKTVNEKKNTFSRELSEENKILNSTEEYDILDKLTLNFEVKLQTLLKTMELPWQVQVIIRVVHLVVWGYILYFYPFPIIGLVGNIIFFKVILPTKLHIIVLIAGGIYLLYYRNK